jgi:hypothetical protein
LRRKGDVGDVPNADDVDVAVDELAPWPAPDPKAGKAAGEVGELENRAVFNTRSFRSSRDRTSDSVRMEISSVPAMVFGSDARVRRAVIIGFIAVVCRSWMTKGTKDDAVTR